MTSIYKARITNTGYMHHNHEDAYWWNNNISDEIKCKGEIECYDNINEIHPYYPVIIYNYVLRYKQRLKKIVSLIRVNH